MVGPQACCNAPPPISKDELAGNAPKASTKGIGTPTSIPTAFQAPTSTPAPVFDLPGLYTNADLQKATKLALKLFIKGQEHG